MSSEIGRERNGET